MGKFLELKKELKNQIDETLEFERDLQDEKVREIIKSKVIEKGKEVYLNMETKEKLINEIFNSIRKYDVLQPYIDDDFVTEIMINGVNDVFIEKGKVINKVDVNFENVDKLEQIIQKIVAKVNRVVNEASPIVDARLEDGSRVSVVMQPIALNGPIVTIRKFSKESIDMKKLINYGTLTEEISAFLEKLVSAKYNIFISGGTSSGKTTFLNALSNYIGKEERVITIEDSAELKIQNVDNLVSLETRDKNVEGKGEVSIRDLIKTSLRMRPDRVIVGEVRGKEAFDMLQAMNTGHDGSMSTGHANSTEDMLSRLETMVLMAAEIPLEAIKRQISSAIDIIIHLGRLPDKSRKVLEINEVLGFDNGKIVTNKLYEYKVNKNDKDCGKLIKIGDLINTYKLDINQFTNN